MYIEIFIFICIIVAVYFAHIYNSDSTKEHLSQNKYNNIWMFWENKNGGKTPVLIDLCIKTVKKHCSKKFNINILNENKIHDYISNIPKNLNKLPIAQKTDYYRIALLYKYGGIWLDADTIVMRDLSPIIAKLKYYDFVGFGCTGHKCKNGYPRPSNQAIASRPRGILMREVLYRLNKLLSMNIDTHNYFKYGKIQIWNSIKLLQSKTNYHYFHYDSSYDGSRKKNGRWVNTTDYFKPNVDILDESSLFFVFLCFSSFKLYGSEVQQKFSKLINMPLPTFLKQPYWICKMIKKSLDIR